MTTIETHPSDAPSAAHPDAHPAIAGSSGASGFFAAVADWVTTTDHKKIGRLYAGFGAVVLAAAAVVGALLGLERADDGSSVIDADALLQLVQVYRVGLIVGGLVPIALGLALAIAPAQVGARQIAFPRVALVGCYFWIGGMALTFVALGRNGGIGGGHAQSVDQFLAGLGLALVGIAASALSVATTVLTARAPGMTMRRVPLFAWSALVGSLALLLVVPVAFGNIIYLFVDHRLGVSANFLGAEGVAAWLGWLFGVPAVLALAVPAVGVAAELIPVTFRGRQQMRGVAFAGIALVATAAFAALSQQRVIAVDLDRSQSPGEFLEDLIPFLLFVGLPLLGLVVVLGLGALTAQAGLAKAGKPNLTPAFLMGFLGLGLVALGAVANALQGLTDLELLGTAFEEGATLLVAYGALLALFGGFVFWAPKLCGVVIPALHVVPLALLGAAGAVLAGGASIVGGILDQPGGIPANDADVQALFSLDFSDAGSLLAVLGLIGHAAVALTVLGFGLLVLKVLGGADADTPANPFSAHTLEWGGPSPLPADNYPVVQTVASAEPVFDLSYEGTL